MQGFSRMQERAVYTQTIHRSLYFASDLSTFPDPANHQFPTLAHAPRNLIHGPGKIMLRSRVCLVDVLQVGEGCSLC
jgi:hypothetical protein